jgi:Fic family protein
MKIVKRKVRGNIYFYLEHSIRDKGKVTKKQKYLGKKIPKNMDKIRSEFWLEIFEENYFSKFDLIKGNFSKEIKLMPKSAREKHYEQFIIKFTYDSNRIEGSTLTLKETANLLELGITPKNKSLEDVKETEAHRNVFDLMLKHKRDLDLNMILHWHRLLFENTKSDIAGKIRKHGVKVARSKTEFPVPAELDLLLRDFFKWYRKNKDLHPVLLAALVHLKFVSIHPLSDGNGRISRIMMNFILNKNKYPMLNIHYNNRDSYYTALERAQVKNIDSIFALYIFKRYLKEYSKYV